MFTNHKQFEAKFDRSFRSGLICACTVRSSLQYIRIIGESTIESPGPQILMKEGVINN